MKNANIVKIKSFDFAMEVIDLYRVLQNKKEYIISKELLRSGTSIGANICEALAGQSRKDFIHKMTIASKEARETAYWLELLNRSHIVQLNYTIHLKKIKELNLILTSIIKTSQENTKKN